jgi:hypothetical protein
VSRRQRRHAVDDPVAAAQAEAGWSPFTLHLRATNQGKLLFPSRHLRGWRAITIWVVAAIILVPFAISLVALLVVILRELF